MPSAIPTTPALTKRYSRTTGQPLLRGHGPYTAELSKIEELIPRVAAVMKTPGMNVFDLGDRLGVSTGLIFLILERIAEAGILKEMGVYKKQTRPFTPEELAELTGRPAPPLYLAHPAEPHPPAERPAERPAVYLTLKQAAARLGVKYQSLRLYIENGRLGAVKIGLRRYVRESDLATFKPVGRGRPRKE